MSYNNNYRGGSGNGNYRSQNDDSENRDPIFFYVVDRTGKPGASVGLFGSKNDQYPGWNSFPIGTLQEFYDAMIRGGFKPTDVIKLRLDEPKSRNSKVAFQLKFVIPNETQVQGQYQDSYHQGQQQQPPAYMPPPMNNPPQGYLQPGYPQQVPQQTNPQGYMIPPATPYPPAAPAPMYPQQGYPRQQEPVPQNIPQQLAAPMPVQQPMPQPVPQPAPMPQQQGLPMQYPAGPNGQRRY